MRLQLAILPILFSLSISNLSIANTDSLIQLLTVYDGDINRVRVLNMLADRLLRSDLDATKQYAGEAFALAQELNDKEGMAESLFLLTYTSIFEGHTDEAITRANDLIILYNYCAVRSRFR